MTFSQFLRAFLSFCFGTVFYFTLHRFFPTVWPLDANALPHAVYWFIGGVWTGKQLYGLKSKAPTSLVDNSPRSAYPDPYRDFPNNER